MIIVVLSGVLAGAIHVVTGPDHLAAVTPLALAHRPAAWRIGLRWGVGHASGTIVLGALALAARSALPLAALGAFAERAVGVVLIVLGLWALRRAWRARVHAGHHEHDGIAHDHVHVHTHDDPTRHRHGHAAVSIGLLHGVAGGSHLLGLVPALALPSTSQSVAFLVAFALASMLAMTAYGLAVGAVAGSLGRRGAGALRGGMTVCSLASIGIGVVWLFG